MKTVLINTIEELQHLVFEQERNNENGRYRSAYMYRGMPDASYHLQTSLDRNCREKASLLEKHLLNNFTKYASIEDPTIKDSVWKAMIIGQHHGLPTRLLDWTHSTIVALHFATSEGNLSDLDKRDCAVWRIDVRELNQRLPERYKQVLDENSTFIFSIDALTQITDSIDEYDKEMMSNSFVVVEPPSIDQRIVNQYSFFSIMPLALESLDEFLANTENTIKYVISKDLRWDLRDMLDQMNMNERLIYPGLDGIAKWLARHYYVKS